jgi:hypothetical protein
MDQSFRHQQSGIGVSGRAVLVKRFNASGYPPGKVVNHKRKWPKHYQNPEAFLMSSKVDSDLKAYSLQSFTEKINPRTVRRDWQVPKMETYHSNIIGFGQFIRKYAINS